MSDADIYAIKKMKFTTKAEMIRKYLQGIANDGAIHIQSFQNSWKKLLNEYFNIRPHV